MKEWKRHAAIVLAAGKGSRMKCDVPKQYLSLKGKPVLYYALKAFEESFIDEIVLVTGVGQEEYCQKEIVEHYGFQKVSHVLRKKPVYNFLLFLYFHSRACKSVLKLVTAFKKLS